MQNLLLLSSIVLAAIATVVALPNANADAQFSSDFELVSRDIGSSCKAPEGTGKCLKTSACKGITYNNLCPEDPANVKCCVVKSCKTNEGPGTCKSKSRNKCSVGDFIPGACPGSSDIQCCVPGVKPKPVIIPKNKCKQYVINAGYKILAKFPGLVHTVWCYANKTGEHGKGRALDFMVKPHAKGGFALATWVMNNHSSLNVKYVIWEQRIWQVRVDKKPKPWSKWKLMKDQHNCNDNHCNHVHVSFN